MQQLGNDMFVPTLSLSIFGGSPCTDFVKACKASGEHEAKHACSEQSGDAASKHAKCVWTCRSIPLFCHDPRALRGVPDVAVSSD